MNNKGRWGKTLTLPKKQPEYVRTEENAIDEHNALEAEIAELMKRDEEE